MNDRMVAASIQGLTVRQASGIPYIILKPSSGPLLEVEIGPAEASLVLLLKEGISPCLPLTHELLEKALEAGAIQVDRLEIHGWDAQGPRCRLHLRQKNRTLLPWDVRPSDGFILALRMGFPVMMDGTLTAGALETGLPVYPGDEGIIPLTPGEAPTLH